LFWNQVGFLFHKMLVDMIIREIEECQAYKGVIKERNDSDDYWIWKKMLKIKSWVPIFKENQNTPKRVGIIPGSYIILNGCKLQESGGQTRENLLTHFSNFYFFTIFYPTLNERV
jgi:hypothetical protein